MPRNGTGTYSPPGATNPVVSGTTITDTWGNGTVNDIASEITNSLPRDGQAPPTNNLPMGGFRHTNAQDPIAAQDYVTLNYLTSSAFIAAGVSPLLAPQALKLHGYQPDLILAKSYAQIVAPNNAAENTIFTVTVPANSMGVNGAVRVSVFYNIASAANIATRMKFDGSTFDSTSWSPGTFFQGNRYFIGNRASLISQMNASEYFGHVTTLVYATSVINTVGARDLVFTVQKTSGVDTFTMEGYMVEIIPST